MANINLSIPTHTGNENPSTVFTDLKSDLTLLSSSINQVLNDRTVTGVVSSGTATTLVDNTATWATNVFANCVVIVWRNNAVVRTDKIVSNTATTLTLNTGAVVQAGDQYAIFVQTTGILLSEKGIANGVPTLDGTTRIVERLSYENIPGGVATLDSQGKVIGNPSGVSVSAFGAVGDGATDDTAAVQSAVNSGAPVIIFDGTKTYLVSSAITIPSGVSLIGNGATILLNTPAGGANVFSLTGTLVAAAGTISVDALKGAFDITLGTLTGIVADDWVHIKSTGVYANDQNGTYPVNKGEIRKVRSVLGTTITLTDAIVDDYLAADTPNVHKISFHTDSSIEGFIFIGPGIAGAGHKCIVAEYAKGLRVRNCRFYGFDDSAIRLSNCINCFISGNECIGVFFDGVTGQNFIFCQILNSSQWINVSNNFCSRVRHLLITSAEINTLGTAGQPLYIDCSNNQLHDAMSGGASSYGIQNHGFGRFLVISNNILYGVYSGIAISNGDVVIKGNIIAGCKYGGIDTTSDWRNPENVLIDGNLIINADSSSTGINTRAISILNANGTVRRNIRISNNVISNMIGASASIGILVQANVGGVDENVCIVNNTITNDTGGVATSSGLHILATGAFVQGNLVLNYARGAYLSGDNIVFLDNRIEYSALNGNMDNGVVVAGKSIFISRTIIMNAFSNQFNSVFLDAASNTCRVQDTVLINSMSTIDNGVANTVIGTVIL